MAVFRVKKNKEYTVMSNHHLRDSGLSLRAKGLLSQILSLPDGWDYTIAGLAAINKEGKDAVRAAVQELEKAGYIERRQTTDAGGKFSINEYVVREYPVSVAPLSGFPTTVFPTTEKPSTEKPSTEKPSTEKPSTEKPLTENPTELNKDKLNTNIPPNPPRGGDSPKKSTGRCPGYKSAAEVLPERFEKFWTFYRTHVPAGSNAGNRQKAIRAWDKLAPSNELAATMAVALSQQVKSQAWGSGVGVPHASTWLNNHGWEDDWGNASGAAMQQGSAQETEGRAEEWL